MAVLVVATEGAPTVADAVVDAQKTAAADDCGLETAE